MTEFSELTGKTLTAVEVNKETDDLIKFATSDGRLYVMFHSQDCCESVGIHEIVGDLEDLIGTPLLSAEEVSNSGEEANKPDEFAESWTWTFYKLSTIKGSVTISWLGTSNGYYSERVDFNETEHAA